MKKSALDLLKTELGQLQSKVSADDRARLEIHASSLRDIERQLEATSAGGADGYFRMGRMLDLTGKSKRGLSNLLVSLWNYMGLTSWGDPLLMPDGAGPMPNLV